MKMTATEFHSAEEKEKVVVKFKRFIEKGFPFTLFTKLLYDYASNMWGHIANYDRGGYYGVWFSSPPRQWEWLAHAVNHKIYGDPAFTRSDVEHALADWIKGSGVLDRKKREVNDVAEQAERAELARLKDKYEGRDG